MSVTTIKTRIRQMLGDFSSSTSDIFTYGSSSVFTLSESNVISITTVYNNDSTIGVVYSYSSTTNKVTITSSLTSGDIIQVDYTYYPNYSDSELLQYIQSTLIYLTINNYGEFEYDSADDAIYPDLEDREENLVAAVTAVLIEKPMDTLRLPDITINFPKNDPVDIKIKKLISSFKVDNRGLGEVIGE
jgi:hypothetical protein